MRKKLSRLIALLLTLAFAAGMTVPALAAPATKYHTIVSPKSSTVYYKGEKIPVSVQIRDEDDPDSIYFHTVLAVASFGWKRTSLEPDTTYTAKIPTQGTNCKPGKHTLKVNPLIGYDTEDGTGIEITTPTAAVSFTLKKLPLPAPATLTAKANKKSVALTWKKGTDAQKYELWRSVKDNQHFKKYKTTTALKYTDTSVKQGVRYYYYVRSLRDKYGKTIRSSRTKVSKAALPLTAPGKPTGVKVAAGRKQVTVSWKKSKLATKYQIYRSLYKGKQYKLIKNTTALKYVDKGVKQGKRYYYQVRSVRVTQTGTRYSAKTKALRSGKVKAAAKATKSATVYVTASGQGACYHRKSCRTLSRSTLVALSLSKAKSMGYRACRVCKP